MCDSRPTMTTSEGAEEEEKWAWVDSGGSHMLKRVLSRSVWTSEWEAAAVRAGWSSAAVSPRRDRFWVVMKIGILRAVAARRSLFVVRRLDHQGG